MIDRPTSADIVVTIGKVAATDWIDPAVEPIYWDCQLYDSNGDWAGEGCGHTAAEAMALAWLHFWAPDALIKGWVEPGEVPFEIPNSWHFKLTPPWRSSLLLGQSGN
jgi:hypothetical protein